MNKLFIVYMHTHRTNNKKYIGITCQKPKDRWRNGKGYNVGYFANAIKLSGWDMFIHEILYEDLTIEQAKEKEIELIAKYNTMNAEYGYNLTIGGNVTTGYKYSEESRKKMSESRIGRHKGELNPMYGMSGEKSPNYGKKFSVEHREKISRAKVGLPRNASTKKKLSEIGKSKIGKLNNNYGNRGRKNPLSKRVLQYDKDGNFIKEWYSMADIERETGISYTTISNVCNGRQKLAHGYVWKLAD